MRTFVVIGRTSVASGEFNLEDLPGTSGRFDVLLRCVRAAMLFSHGVRRDVSVYLLLGGGNAAPRTLRFRGSDVKFLRPDERSLAVLARKVLAQGGLADPDHFVEIKPGVALFSGGLSGVLADLGPAAPYVLDENGPDVRGEAALIPGNASFFLGDHNGIDETARAALSAFGARSISVGPKSLHAEDAISVLTNEIDRREAAASGDRRFL